MTKDDLSWYVVYTYPKQEKRIFSDLIKQSINAFLPFQKVVRQWSDRKKKLTVPLFPNYVFVQVPEKERFKVFSVPGVTRFISFEGKPAIVSNDEINIIKQLVNHNISFENEVSLTSGDRVKVVHGPLAGLQGILVDRKGGKRFGIHFDSISQSISVDIQYNFLERVA
jgi:transcription elongation factor/antiterminator RfaH